MSKRHRIISSRAGLDYSKNRTQNIIIKYKRELSNIPMVFVDEKNLCVKEVEQLAKNEGFNDVNEFYNHFITDFNGVILHFTRFRYAE